MAEFDQKAENKKILGVIIPAILIVGAWIWIEEAEKPIPKPPQNWDDAIKSENKRTELNGLLKQFPDCLHVTILKTEITLDFSVEQSIYEKHKVALTAARALAGINASENQFETVTVKVLYRGFKRYELDYDPSKGEGAQRTF